MDEEEHAASAKSSLQLQNMKDTDPIHQPHWLLHSFMSPSCWTHDRSMASPNGPDNCDKCGSWGSRCWCDLEALREEDQQWGCMWDTLLCAAGLNRLWTASSLRLQRTQTQGISAWVRRTTILILQDFFSLMFQSFQHEQPSGPFLKNLPCTKHPRATKSSAGTRLLLMVWADQQKSAERRLQQQ